MTACALVRQEVLGTRDPLRRQQLFEVRRMVRLSAAATCGLFLVNGLVGAERIGGWGRRRVGGIGVELGPQLAHLRFELRNAEEEFLTSWTRRHWHADQLTKSASRQLRQFGDDERLPIFILTVGM